MRNFLIVNSSALGDTSVSRRLVGELVDRLASAHPDATIVERDLGGSPLPHLSATTLAGFGGGDDLSPEAAVAGQLSNMLIAEIKAADVIVIGAPMYNFGITSTLKSWFDHVLRAGKTFAYSAEGPVGLFKGKRAIVIETRGGFYSEGAGQALDAQEPHLRAMLGLIGIADIRFVRAERLAVSPEARAAAIEQAKTALKDVSSNILALAA